MARLDVLRQQDDPEAPAMTSGFLRGTAPSSVSVGGIRISTIARSGIVASTTAISSSASAATPTMSWPASANKRASPSRNRTPSSAITMRKGAPPR